jgi:hypothetical protein
MPPANVPTPGVAKIVKLGTETLLVVEVQNGAQVAEGQWVITAITANPSGPAGAGDCGIQIRT